MEETQREDFSCFADTSLLPAPTQLPLTRDHLCNADIPQEHRLAPGPKELPGQLPASLGWHIRGHDAWWSQAREEEQDCVVSGGRVRACVLYRNVIPVTHLLCSPVLITCSELHVASNARRSARMHGPSASERVSRVSLAVR